MLRGVALHRAKCYRVWQMALRDPLLRYRIDRNLTQAQLAKRLKVSRQMVAALENGTRPYTADMALRIEKKLGIPREMVRPDYFTRPA